jgi:hypothetical protein
MAAANGAHRGKLRPAMEKMQAGRALGRIGVVLNSPLIRRIYSSIG